MSNNTNANQDVAHTRSKSAPAARATSTAFVAVRGCGRRRIRTCTDRRAACTRARALPKDRDPPGRVEPARTPRAPGRGGSVPSGTTQHQPVLRGLELLTRVLQAGNAFREQPSAAEVFPSIQSTLPMRQSSRERRSGSRTCGRARSRSSSASANASDASASSAAATHAGTASSKRAAPSRWRATCNEPAPAARHVGRAAVDLLSPRQHDLVGDCLLCQRVPPAVRRAVASDLVEQLLRHAHRERPCTVVSGTPGDGDERCSSRTSCRVRRRPGESPPRPDRAVEPQQDRVADGFGDAQLLHRAPLPALPRAKDVAAIDRFLQHLLEHERIPFRLECIRSENSGPTSSSSRMVAIISAISSLPSGDSETSSVTANGATSATAASTDAAGRARRSDT